jgi:predicted nucleotidyltransferase
MATQRKIKVTSLDEIRELIDQHRPELKRQFHVDKIGVFGSYARGKQKKRSDVDFLVTFGKDISLMELGGLYSFLQDTMGRRVHVVHKDDIRPEFRDGIIRDVLYI